MLSAYGGLSLRGSSPLNYEDWFGLWLNLDRVRYQRAIEAAIGLSAALTAEELPPGYYDGICPLAEQVEDVQGEDELDRAIARKMSMRGRGP